jgi:hypothetical protein
MNARTLKKQLKKFPRLPYNLPKTKKTAQGRLFCCIEEEWK